MIFSWNRLGKLSSTKKRLRFHDFLSVYNFCNFYREFEVEYNQIKPSCFHDFKVFWISVIFVREFEVEKRTLAVDLLATFFRDLATLKIDSAIVNFRISFESSLFSVKTQWQLEWQKENKVET